jgi:two-component system sensor histidine kinase KdpD
MGKPGKPKLRDLIFGSFIDRLTRKCGEIDLYLISGEIEEVLPKAQPYAPLEPLSWKGIFWAIGAVAICTVVNGILFPYLALSNLVMVFFLGIAWLAFSYGRRVATIGTLLSIASFDFFFVPPYFTFSVLEHQHIITFAVMLIIGLVIGGLTGRLRRQTIVMRTREQRTQVLYSLSQDLAKSSRPQELFQILLSHVQDFFKCPAVIFTETPAKKLEILTAVANGRELALKEQETANWSYQHRKTAGNGTETLAGSVGFYIPLVASQDVVGVLGIFPGDSKDFLSPDNYHVLEMFIKQTALAVEGALLEAANIKAENELEKTRLRNMILDTSAYDVKGSLLAISQAASELADENVINNYDKRNNLIKKIQVQAKQLDELVGELPKIIDELKQP